MAAMELTISAALGGLSGLLAGMVSRAFAAGTVQPDRLSLVLAVGGAVVAGIQPTTSPGPLVVCLSAAVLWLLLVVLACDVRERAVYPMLVYPGVALTAVAAPLRGLSVPDALLGAVTGAAVFGLFYLLARLRYGHGAFGDGDVAVAALLGSVVGLSELPQALLMVGVFGAIIAVVAGFRSRSLRASFPYAPALCLAALVVRLN
jgi:prepilin signal peptidase PulO-like enzyme (type II secretory pathway)